MDGLFDSFLKDDGDDEDPQMGKLDRSCLFNNVITIAMLNIYEYNYVKLHEY